LGVILEDLLCIDLNEWALNFQVNKFFNNY
jgi:hypothetical protein